MHQPRTSHPLPDGLEPCVDAAAVMTSIGDLVERGNVRDGDGWAVRAMVPGPHEAYVRILHPAWDDGRHTSPVTWSTIAGRNGATLEGTVAFRRITVPPGAPIPKGPQGAWEEDAAPLMGALPEEETGAVVALLFPADACWFLLWDGRSGLRQDERQVTVSWQGNPHLVFRGPVEAVLRFDWTGQWQTPHLWCSDDRTWCLGTDIDGLETYVGGSKELIERIHAEPRLETLIVGPDDLALVSGDWLQTE